MKTLLEFLTPFDWIALGWFTLCWLGYAIFSHRQAKQVPTIATSLSDVRGIWMHRVLAREVRIGDVTALGILQRNVTFFASTTMFILAGLLTVLGATDQVIDLTNSLPFIAENTRASFEFKLLVLVFAFVYAFFRFSWSVRQYNFAIVMLGAAPEPDAPQDVQELFVVNANQILTRANDSFAHGLRAYSFAMAILSWFIHPVLFMIASSWVVAVLYRREFRSYTLKALKSAGKLPH
ncbi:DUF599 domain-containing protein [Pleionea mediterranea]|uniref:Putative membrane protein n=1 Tax=Pleionea mediterranea TaxID=523701 RepID=A0A316FWD0_9GAMM|nr:DUF599 domain-containing protein [Pleionea mediterranea]PWK52869.1 putative membrane protein [Pleionea mediterranea]